MVRATKSIVVGDPLKEETRHGALISKEHLLNVKSFIKEAINEVFSGFNVIRSFFNKKKTTFFISDI